MSPPRGFLRVFLAAAVVAGCNKDYPNPFASINQTLPPGANAALLLTSGVYATRSGAPRELYGANADGSGLSRLTFCDAQSLACDTIEASAGPDRSRVVARRVTDSNRDGVLSAAADGEALVFIDLARAAEQVIVPATQKVSGADWSPVADVIAYSGTGEGGVDDLFRIDPNGANGRNLTSTPDVRERRPRIDPTGSVAVYERIDAGGKGEVWIFNSSLSQVRVTTGGPGSQALAGTLYLVGSDADPGYSPDGRSIVFRRLTGIGNGGLGTWDVLRVAPDGTGLAVLATGPLFRGAPDWGRQGIVFTEIDAAAGVAQLVQVQPDGSGRKLLLTQGAGFSLSYPRWLP